MSPRKTPTDPETFQLPPALAEQLAANREGRLAPTQRRVVGIGAVVALVILLCPLALLVQLGGLLLAGTLSVGAPVDVIVVVIGVLFILVFAALVGVNVQMFVPDLLGHEAVRYAQGPLEIHVSAGNRPELPFSYIVGDYSFAPYVVPEGVPMQRGAPYLVYYAAHSRLLLSIVPLDMPGADGWMPRF